MKSNIRFSNAGLYLKRIIFYISIVLMSKAFGDIISSIKETGVAETRLFVTMIYFGFLGMMMRE